MGACLRGWSGCQGYLRGFYACTQWYSCVYRLAPFGRQRVTNSLHVMLLSCRYRYVSTPSNRKCHVLQQVVAITIVSSLYSQVKTTTNVDSQHISRPLQITAVNVGQRYHGFRFLIYYVNTTTNNVPTPIQMSALIIGQRHTNVLT